MKIVRWFILSAGILLTITALGKLVGSLGNARVLDTSEPILMISFRHIFVLVGIIELAIALYCFFGKRVILKSAAVACLTANFAIYRFSLPLVGYHKPCICLGSLTTALHIEPETADNIMKIILAYLFAGSFSALCWLWWRGRQNLHVSAA